MRKLLGVVILSLCIFTIFFTSVQPAEASTKADRIVAIGKKYIGVKYRIGGMSPKGFDCSGFVGYTYKKATGRTLPRTAASLFLTGRSIYKSTLKKGDLVFFSNGSRKASHTGIYIGHNRFIHASTSSGVRIDSLNGYWRTKFIGGRRI